MHKLFPSPSNHLSNEHAITRTFAFLPLCFQYACHRPRNRPHMLGNGNELLTRQEAAGGNHAGPSAEGRNLNHMAQR
jgi:hypothetical protein